MQAQHQNFWEAPNFTVKSKAILMSQNLRMRVKWSDFFHSISMLSNARETLVSFFSKKQTINLLKKFSLIMWKYMKNGSITFLLYQIVYMYSICKFILLANRTIFVFCTICNSDEFTNWIYNKYQKPHRLFASGNKLWLIIKQYHF